MILTEGFFGVSPLFFMRLTPQTVYFFYFVFFFLLLPACTDSLAQRLPEQDIEIFATGKKYSSVEEYLRVRRNEKTPPVVSVVQPPAVVSPVKPSLDENGWRTIVVDQMSDEPPVEFVERFVAGIDSFETGTSGSTPVRKVATIREMNAGLAAEASKTSAPLLILAEGGKVKVLELTRKANDKLQSQTPQEPLLQGE